MKNVNILIQSAEEIKGAVNQLKPGTTSTDDYDNNLIHEAIIRTRLRFIEKACKAIRVVYLPKEKND